MESLLKDLRKSTDGASAGDGAFAGGFGEGRAGAGGDELDDATMAALFEQMTQNPEAAASLLQTLASLDGANQRNDEASASEESGPKFPPGMMGIDPLPGFVFKTKLAETKDNWKKGMKVFINVCYHEVIPPPPDASLDEIAKAAEEGNHAAYKMPLSLAGPTIDRDKTGTLCLVFEACISPSSVEKAKVDSGFLSWVAELCFEWLEEKHKIALEREFTLPKLKAKGKLSTHVVRQNIKPKIMEMPKKAAVVDHKEPVTEPVIPSIYAVSADPVMKASSKGRLPQYSIELNPISKPKEVIVTVKLLEAVSPSQSTLLQIESEKLFLLPNPNSAIPYPYDPLEVNIPVVFDVDGDVDAGFDRATRTLKVVLPIIA